jgi:hypothetical protein
VIDLTQPIVGDFQEFAQINEYSSILIMELVNFIERLISLDFEYIVLNKGNTDRAVKILQWMIEISEKI